MYPAQARQHHQLKHSFDEDMSVLADKRVNPSLKIVQHIRSKWLKDNHGQFDNISVMESINKTKSVRPNDRIACVSTSTGFVAVLITEFMMRVHEHLPSSSEVVFIDTTSHVDSTNCALTILVCDSPAGGMPLGVIITSTQTKEDYLQGQYVIKGNICTLNIT